MVATLTELLVYNSVTVFSPCPPPKESKNKVSVVHFFYQQCNLPWFILTAVKGMKMKLVALGIQAIFQLYPLTPAHY